MDTNRTRSRFTEPVLSGGNVTYTASAPKHANHGDGESWRHAGSSGKEMSRACDFPNRLTTEKVCLRAEEGHDRALNVVVSDACSVVVILVNEAARADRSRSRVLTNSWAPGPTPPKVSTPDRDERASRRRGAAGRRYFVRSGCLECKTAAPEA